MADSRELTIAKGVETALNQASVTVSGGTLYRPAGLTVHRQRQRAVEADTLPSQLVFIVSEGPVANADYAVGLLTRSARISVESRVEVPEDIAPDDALDDLKVWAEIAVMDDETLGGVSQIIDVREGQTLVEEGAKTFARHARVFEIQYENARADPRTA